MIISIIAITDDDARLAANHDFLISSEFPSESNLNFVNSQPIKLNFSHRRLIHFP